MSLEPKYQPARLGQWRFWVRNGGWSRSLQAETLARLNQAAPSRHPQTFRFHNPAGAEGSEYYLKVYHRGSLASLFKDLFRDSKAFRALKQGEALSLIGMDVPIAAAAGEERKGRLLQRAFLVTEGVQGDSLPLFLRDLNLPPDRASVKKKRFYIKQLAAEVRRMHEAGFVHGDMVPSNILVGAERERIRFFFIDHDRTRRYPAWLPQGLWRRNLVQLNRFVLPGISLQDRVRFLKCYLNSRRLGKKERRLAAWLEAKTRKRRLECDRIDTPASFRELMRWNGPFASNHSQTGRQS